MSGNKVFLKVTEKKANELIDKFGEKAIDVANEIEQAIIDSVEDIEVQNLNQALRWWSYVRYYIGKDKFDYQLPSDEDIESMAKSIFNKRGFKIGYYSGAIWMRNLMKLNLRL